MIKITVETKNGVQIVKEGTIVKGSLKDLLFELTALQSAIVDAIVEQNKENLQPGVDILTAKFNMVDTMAQTTKVAIESNHKYTSDTTTTVQHIKPLQEEPKEAAEEETVNDLLRKELGLDMDNINWQIYATHELVDKWWIILSDHIVTNDDIEQFIKDASSLGITHLDLINKIKEKYGEE